MCMFPAWTILNELSHGRPPDLISQAGACKHIKTVWRFCHLPAQLGLAFDFGDLGVRPTCTRNDVSLTERLMFPRTYVSSYLCVVMPVCPDRKTDVSPYLCVIIPVCPHASVSPYLYVHGHTQVRLGFSTGTHRYRDT